MSKGTSKANVYGGNHNEKSNQFIKLVGDELLDNSEFPDRFQVAAHLKLLHSFEELRKSTVQGIDNEQEREKLWQCYITMAVRRFVIFVSALKFKFMDLPNSEDPKFRKRFSDFMDGLLPPIDVILVWHSFCLNPKSFFDNFQYNNLILFVRYPFPLVRINQSISNEKFIFIPSIEFSDAYTKLVEDFMILTQMEEPTNFNSYQPFDPFTIDLPVFCILCSKKFEDCKLTNDQNSGFADKDFKIISYPCCGFNSEITHTQLRTRKFFNDYSNNSKLLPSIYKYYSSSLNRVDDSMVQADKSIRKIVSVNEGPFKNIQLVEFCDTFYKYFGKFDWLIFRDYFELNCISSTIPVSSSTFHIHEDLVACVIRQERFIKKMVLLDWLHSQFIEVTVINSIDRYLKFMNLVKNSQVCLISTLDIDLVWHTHQLNHPSYYEYTTQRIGRFIDHNDKIEENRLTYGFDETCKAFENAYGENYSICLCYFCSLNRIKKRGLLNKLKRKPSTKASLVENELYSLTHISTHNSVLINTDRRNHLRRYIWKKYEDDHTQPLPWDDDMYLKELSFITNPILPAQKDDLCHLRLYKNGICGTAVDKASACGGLTGSCGDFSKNSEPALGSGAKLGSLCGSNQVITYRQPYYNLNNKAG